MSFIGLCFVLASAIALLLVPRRWAPVPLIVGTCYMTLNQGLQLGPFNFTVIRMLVAVGVVRVLVRREPISGGLNGLDGLMAVFAVWAVASSFFHADPRGALVFRLGLVYNACGIYFLFRVFCSSVDDVVRLVRATAFLLLPIGLEMIYEHVALHNLFSIFGGQNMDPQLREGRIRALGPFAHPILAGTVGAVSLPMMIAIWRDHRTTAVVGILSCLAIIVSSASSGPALSAVLAIGALFMWRYRSHMRVFRWLMVAGYIVLDLVMKAPAYFLFARIDVVGGSTGWHRARLMQSAFEHFNEWWLAGTDYTRHWMPTGVEWSPDQTDITNYYLSMGVMGGLPLMLLLIAIMAKAFSYAGGRLKDDPDMPPKQAFVIWALGASLFAHAAQSFSIAYFDQSFLFFYMTPAVLASIRFEKLVVAAPRLGRPTSGKAGFAASSRSQGSYASGQESYRQPAAARRQAVRPPGTMARGSSS